MLAAGVLLLLSLAACSREPASLKALKTERALADSLEKGFTPSNPDSLAKVVIAARGTTKKFLINHKDDVPAAVLFVKLRLAEEALTPQEEMPLDSTGAPPDHFARSAHAKLRLVDCVETLDHAISVEPKNPELYYWKALVLGLWEPIYDKQALDLKRSKLPQAIECAEKALALAPDSASYRTVLASYQMISGDDVKALKTLRAGKDTNNPMLLILSDWEKFPRPEGAVYSARESAGIAQWMAASGLDDASARVRAYWVPGTQAAIRAYYGKQWNGLYWLGQKQPSTGSEQLSFGSAAVVIEAGGFKPVTEADIKGGAMANAQGISIQVREVKNPSAKSREAIPFDAGNVVCEVLLTNHRRAR
jgi:tetratricopeptide (TPR) repeat protein